MDKVQFWGKYVAFNSNQWGLRGVVILRREGRRRGSSQITSGFLVQNRQAIRDVVDRDAVRLMFMKRWQVRATSEVAAVGPQLARSMMQLIVMRLAILLLLLLHGQAATNSPRDTKHDSCCSRLVFYLSTIVNIVVRKTDQFRVKLDASKPELN